MPNRILREGILTSRRVNLLSERAELLYRRLMSRLDDYGRHEADPELIRSACFPLRVNKVKAIHVKDWLLECRSAGLIVIYQADDAKLYLQYLDWKQQERSASKCPAPAQQLISDAEQMISLKINDFIEKETGVISDAAQLLANDINCSLSRIRSRSTCTEGDYMSGKPDDASPEKQKNGHDHSATAKGILAFLNEKTGRHYQPVKVNIEMIVARLKEGATETELRQVIAKKCREWAADEKMNEYLRPATLFNRTKFAQYQGELLQPGAQDG